MKFEYSVLVFAASILIVLSENLDYKGFRVYNVKFETKEQQNRFHLIKRDEIDYWRKPSLEHGIVGKAMVPPEQFQWFEERLEELGLERDVAVEDVYDFIVERSSVKTSRNDTQQQFDFEDYYRYDVILRYLYELQERYSNSTTILLEIIESGQTEGGRPLVHIKLTSKNATTATKPIVLIEAGIIPREWVTIPSALYVVEKLLEDEVTPLLSDFDWIVIPVLNPDGYEYTHTNLRFWTKNRSTKSHLGFICPGVNINRNFDIDWSTFDSSSSPCSHMYAGIQALSEEESQFVHSILEQYGSRIRLYLSIQNTGGFITYPWHYEQAASGLFRQHLLLSRDMIAAMNTSYTAGISSVIYGERASGTSIDHARTQQILYTFNLDIIDGDDGVMVPEHDIVDIAEDVWRAVRVAANTLDKYL